MIGRLLFNFWTTAGITTLAIVASPPADALPPTQFQQSLSIASGVQTRESIEVVDGARYRRIETTSGIYYLKLLAGDDSTAQIDCEKPVNAASPRLMEGSVQVTHRTRAFVSLLQETCGRSGAHWVPRQISLNPMVGIKISDQPKDVVKDKAIYLTPLTGLGFSGTF